MPALEILFALHYNRMKALLTETSAFSDVLPFINIIRTITNFSSISAFRLALLFEAVAADDVKHSHPTGHSPAMRLRR